MKTKDIVNISLFATLLAVCSWICIPTIVPVTMQTFAVFLALLVLGAKKGIIVISIYLFLGIIGLPVFSRGTAGIGVLLGNTGGYMIGWFCIAAMMLVTEKLFRNLSENQLKYKKWIQAAGLTVGLILCYLFGALWFINIYTGNADSISFQTVLGMCVIPFVIPDLVKMFLAFAISKRIRKIVLNV